MSRNTSSYWKGSWIRFKNNPLALSGIIVLVSLILLAIFVPMLSPYTYYDTNLSLKNQSPSWNHLFGTDELGRDIFTRIFYGARISLFVGLTAATIDLVLGIIYGSISALSHRHLDEMLMRLTDILHSIPYLLVVILLMVVMGPGVLTIIIALTMTGWIGMARMVRGQIMQLKEQDFVKAALVMGASKYRITFYHLIPNCIGPIIVTVTLTVPTAIFAEAFLSFLGLGVSAPIASWGSMASDGLSAMRYYPWRLFFPAFFISTTMLSFNLIGDGLQDAFNPKVKP